MKTINHTSINKSLINYKSNKSNNIFIDFESLPKENLEFLKIFNLLLTKIHKIPDIPDIIICLSISLLFFFVIILSIPHNYNKLMDNYDIIHNYDDLVEKCKQHEINRQKAYYMDNFITNKLEEQHIEYDNNNREVIIITIYNTHKNEIDRGLSNIEHYYNTNNFYLCCHRININFYSSYKAFNKQWCFVNIRNKASLPNNIKIYKKSSIIIDQLLVFVAFFLFLFIAIYIAIYCAIHFFIYIFIFDAYYIDKNIYHSIFKDNNIPSFLLFIKKDFKIAKKSYNKGDDNIYKLKYHKKGRDEFLIIYHNKLKKKQILFVYKIKSIYVNTESGAIKHCGYQLV